MATVADCSLPLDKQFIPLSGGKDGRKETIEALHPKWSEQINFMKYSVPPDEINDVASLEEWIFLLTNIKGDLHWLLQQPHQQFWCQVLFDDTLHRCLDSYLKLAPRAYDHAIRLPDSARSMLKSVHRLVFMTFLRMSTHKESKDCYITPSAYGEMIYDNFIFDIPKLFDLCILYGGGNNAILSKMISNIFSQQPRYNDDLNDIVPMIIQIFENIKEKCGLGDISDEPQILSADNVKSVFTLSSDDFRDIIFYLSDIGMTLLAFLEIYPEASCIFHQHTFVSRLSACYETLVPELEKSLKQRKSDHPSLCVLLKSRLCQAKKALVKTCHNILSTCCVQPILENSGQEEGLNVYIEDYLQILSAFLSEKHFLVYYNDLFPIEDDIHIVTQISTNIDETRIWFILDAISNAGLMFGKKTLEEKKPCQDKTVTDQQIKALPEEFESTPYCELEGACAASVTGVELESLISAIKDLFPELGEGFVEVCLEEYNYDSEKIINDLLEDKLMSSLQELDRTMARVETKEDETLLSQRQSVYDNDEFDVFNRDTIDTTKIHKGKKSKDYIEMFENKSELRDIKSHYAEYNDVYDDEYDDTYDDNDIGANDNDSADELTTRRPFTTPRILTVSAKDASGASESSEEEVKTKPLDMFIPNPAEVRARQEATRRSKYESRNKDILKGQPKGKGQSAQTERKRHDKDKHKASRANHNRKIMSDKKRSKAMI